MSSADSVPVIWVVVSISLKSAATLLAAFCDSAPITIRDGCKKSCTALRDELENLKFDKQESVQKAILESSQEIKELKLAKDVVNILEEIERKLR